MEDSLTRLCTALDGKQLDSSGAVLTAVADGSALVGITLEETALQHIAAGEDIALVYPSDGTSCVPDGSALVKGAPHGDNARLFLDFTVSTDVQSMVGQRFCRRTVRADIPADPSLPPLSTLNMVSYDVEWASQNRDRLLSEWSFLAWGGAVMTRPQSRSFRNRLLLSFLIASLAPMIICSTMLSQISRIQMTKQLDTDAQTQTAHLMTALDRISDALPGAARALEESRLLPRALPAGRTPKSIPPCSWPLRAAGIWRITLWRSAGQSALFHRQRYSRHRPFHPVGRPVRGEKCRRAGGVSGAHGRRQNPAAGRGASENPQGRTAGLSGDGTVRGEFSKSSSPANTAVPTRF